MEELVPFKVYTYWNEIEKPEVRRFGVERSVVTSYHYLTAKLQDVFPRLKNKNYKVSWKGKKYQNSFENSEIHLFKNNVIIQAIYFFRRRW